jgi:hypothetical protein
MLLFVVIGCFPLLVVFVFVSWVSPKVFYVFLFSYIKMCFVDVTNRVFGEEKNPTPCTIVTVPGSVSYHVQNSLQNSIISIQRNQSTNHNIYIRNNSVYEFSTSPLG